MKGGYYIFNFSHAPPVVAGTGTGNNPQTLLGVEYWERAMEAFTSGKPLLVEGLTITDNQGRNKTTYFPEFCTMANPVKNMLYIYFRNKTYLTINSMGYATLAVAT